MEGMMSVEAVCFLDMDGVLVDFIGGSLKAHGINLHKRDCEWSFFNKLGLTDAQFWDPLGHDFWANLEWTSEGKELIKELEYLFRERIVLCTSPCETPGGVEGKIAWIKRELPAYRRRFFVGPPKALAASPCKVLIDDHDLNVEAFVLEGGHGVLVPRPWNRNKHLTNDEGDFEVKRLIAQIERALDCIAMED